ncbi:hypothetical protein ACFQHN_34985 [Natrialbaceae archaeon GCM10025896]
MYNRDDLLAFKQRALFRSGLAMGILRQLQRFRNWFPVPTMDGRPRVGRWLLLEGNRIAVAGALLTFVYAVLMFIGTFWSFEMRVLLTETQTVENILDTFLSGIILLVSIVVSINSIVLSQDMTSIEKQEDRIRGVGDFWQDVDDLTETNKGTTDIRAFLESMTAVIQRHADQIADEAADLESDFDELANQYSESVTGSLDHLEEIDNIQGGDFALLWMALEIEYGPLLDRTHGLRSRNEQYDSESFDESLDSLVEAFQLFAVGREYFKTMYYTAEVSRLSRVLLVVSLPAILITASAILAISADLFPEWWILGLPPLHSLVSTVFAIALLPYIVLTSFMLRLSTVAQRTNAEGVFSMG